MSENKNPQGGGNSANGTNNKGTPNAWGTNKKKQQGGGNDQNANSANKNKRFEGGTKGLEEDTFYYGPGMDKKFIKSKEKVLSFISKRFTASEAVSIEKDKLTLLGHKIPKRIQTKTDFDAMTFWEQEQWRIDMKRYTDNTHTLQKNLTTCYAIIWDQMNTTLQNQVKREKGFTGIEMRRDAMNLFALVAKICTGTSDVEDYMTKSVESLYAVLTLSGNKMSLGDYYKLFNERRKNAYKSGILLASIKQQAGHSDNVVKKNGWDKKTSSEYKAWVVDQEEHTEEQFYAITFLRQSGDRYEEVRRTIRNDLTKGNDNIPYTVEDVYSLLQRYQLEPKSSKKGKGDEKKGNEKVHDDESKKFPGHSFQQKTDFK